MSKSEIQLPPDAPRIPRYDLDIDYTYTDYSDGCIVEIECNDGDWCRWDDVKKLLIFLLSS